MTTEAAGRVVVCEPDALAAACASWLGRAMARAIAGRSRCTIALAGGSSPKAVYAALATPPLRDTVDWSRVMVFFGDERAVPPDHADSNYRMVKEVLLDRVPIISSNVHRMVAERANRDAAAIDYQRQLPPALDVLMLGMGPDGHTASLFPGAGALVERARRVVPVVGPKPPANRLTITPLVIAAARTIVVLAPGAEKAAMVAAALEAATDPRRVPARLARRGTWFLDTASAAQLPPEARTP